MIQEKIDHNSHILNHQQAEAEAKSLGEVEEVERQLETYLDEYYYRIERLNEALKKRLDEIDKEEKTDIVKLYLLDNLPD